MTVTFRIARNFGLSILVAVIILMGLNSLIATNRITATLNVVMDEEIKLEIADRARRNFRDAKDIFVSLIRGEGVDVAIIESLMDRAIGESMELKKLVTNKEEIDDVTKFISSSGIFRKAILSYVEKAKSSPNSAIAAEMEKSAMVAADDASEALSAMIRDIITSIKVANIAMLKVARTSQGVSTSVLLLGVMVGIFVAFLMGPTLSKPILRGVSKIKSAADQILSASQQQAGGIEEEAAQISHVTNTARQLADTAKQVNSIGNEIARSSASSVRIANSGAEVVENTVSGMEKLRRSVLETARKIESLGERSQAITDIVTLIEDIADQTNLLSLNAAIEAARAGEVGKGFAVVADAIGRLAERTTKSTKNISELIKGVQQDTSSCVMSMEESTKEAEKGTSLAQEAGKNIKEIVGAIQHVAEAAKEISQTSQQQMSGSEQVSRAMIGVDQIMRQSAISAKQSTESAKTLVALADEFRKILGEGKVQKITGSS